MGRIAAWFLLGALLASVPVLFTEGEAVAVGGISPYPIFGSTTMVPYRAGLSTSARMWLLVGIPLITASLVLLTWSGDLPRAARPGPRSDCSGPGRLDVGVAFAQAIGLGVAVGLIGLRWIGVEQAVTTLTEALPWVRHPGWAVLQVLGSTAVGTFVALLVRRSRAAPLERLGLAERLWCTLSGYLAVASAGIAFSMPPLSNLM